MSSYTLGMELDFFASISIYYELGIFLFAFLISIWVAYGLKVWVMINVQLVLIQSLNSFRTYNQNANSIIGDTLMHSIHL